MSDELREGWQSFGPISAPSLLALPPACLTSFWPSPCSPCPAKFIYSLITLRRNVSHTVLAPLLCCAPVCRHTETLASAITLVRDQLKMSRLLLPPFPSGL